jgi:hypothetical protein
MPTLERDATVVIALDPDFPVGDVRTIADRLAASGVVVPGFIPPAAGLLTFEALAYASYVECTPTVILPDRNIVSRMARAARDGLVHPVDGPTQTAVDLMALAQAMNFDVEPSIAFHELAHRDGNPIANEELRWFRAADNGQAKAWIDLALGRSNQLTLIEPGPSTNFDLATPIHRYRCNYAIALRVAALELDPKKTSLERATALIGWMVSDFIVAGPAAIFAAMFLSPRASRAGMLKQIKSLNRARALAGVCNAAWDITHLSDFVRRAKATDHDKQRFVFATADQTLAELGNLLFSNAEQLDGFKQQLAAAILPWWAKDATAVAKLIADAIILAEQRLSPGASPGVEDYIGHQIAVGEHAVTNWTPG